MKAAQCGTAEALSHKICRKNGIASGQLNIEKVMAK
jgi:hypothetical protein